jgi:site-specific recombinase XerD
LKAIRLRRYRIPIKLIYCCGLRLSECLSLTIQDIIAKEGKLWIRGGKGNKDRMVPTAKTMVEDSSTCPLFAQLASGHGGSCPGGGI